jgi:uncharacterized OsmC-like protein
MSDVETAVSGMISALEAEPAKAKVRFRAATDLEDGVRCDVRTGKHTIVIDEPPVLGGEDAGASPVEAVLAGLVSCQAITYRVWAGKLGVELDKVSVDVEGDLDLQGFFGLDEGARSGFSALRLNVSLSGPESPERYRELADAVDRHCPVLDMFSRTAPVTRTLVEPAAVPA